MKTLYAWLALVSLVLAIVLWIASYFFSRLGQNRAKTYTAFASLAATTLFTYAALAVNAPI
jgi:predicted exporter